MFCLFQLQLPQYWQTSENAPQYSFVSNDLNAIYSSDESNILVNTNMYTENVPQYSFVSNNDLNTFHPCNESNIPINTNMNAVILPENNQNQHDINFRIQTKTQPSVRLGRKYYSRLFIFSNLVSK